METIKNQIIVLNKIMNKFFSKKIKKIEENY